MTRNLAGLFGELGRILCVCPCCGELFYLLEARPYLTGKRPRSVVDRLRAEEEKIDGEESELFLQESALREAAAEAGLKTAKRLLKKIDPVFSGAGYDLQDVKVIFNPVTYIVFDGLANNRLKNIALLVRPPDASATEQVMRSIRRIVEKGNFEFKTLHVDHEGHVVFPLVA